MGRDFIHYHADCSEMCIRDRVKSEDVNPNQVTALRCQFTPEYTRPADIGTTRALLQGVEFEKWTGVVTDGKDCLLYTSCDFWSSSPMADRYGHDHF